MYPDTAAGFVSGSLCLLELKWGDEKESGLSLEREKQAQIPGCVTQWSSSIIPDGIQCGIHTARLAQWVDLVFSIAWCGGVVGGSQPCWFVYSLSVGLRSQQGREFVGVLIEEESIWDGKTLFAWLIKQQCSGDCPFFIPHALKSAIFGQENPLLSWSLPLFQRELKQMTVFFFPSRGKCWLNWVLRVTASRRLVLKELLTALIPSSKRVYKKSRSMESKSAPLSASKVGGHGETFQIVKENTSFSFLPNRFRSAFYSWNSLFFGLF